MRNASSAHAIRTNGARNSREPSDLTGRRLATPNTPPASRYQREPGRRVTVIGAGIVGLVAAFELERMGYHVEVLEASRIGGRIYSHRFGSDADAPVAELGAMRIPTKNPHTMAYIDRLGLTDEVRPFRTLLADENAFLR